MGITEGCCREMARLRKVRRRLAWATASHLFILVTLAACFVSIAAADVVIGTPGSGAGEVNEPRGVAVDRTAGLLYLADRGNNRVDVFDVSTGAFIRAFGWGVADGTTPALQSCMSTCFSGIAGSGLGQFASGGLRGIAVDSSSHTVYVVDGGNHRVEKFTATGEFLFAIGGAVGSGEGQFNEIGGVAIDTGGVVYIGDQIGNEPSSESRVQKYDSSGAYLGQILLEVPGGAGGTTGIAVSSIGDFYVGTNGSTGAVRRYDGSGKLLATLDPSFNINALTVDSSDNLFVGDNTAPFGAILKYDSTDAQVQTFYGTLSNRVFGLALSPDESSIFAVEEGRFGALGSGLVEIPLPPPGPIASPGPNSTFASPLGNVRATLHSTVNPEGKSTTYHFEYVDQNDFEEGGFGSASTVETTESAPIGADFELHSAEAAIGCPKEPTCLTPATVYHVRVIASNADAPGGNPGPEATFETEPPLRVDETWASEVGTDTATLNAAVNPFGFAATGRFQYVNDASFQANGFAEAQEVPSGATPIDFGAGEVDVTRTAQLFALTPATTYHYRVVVSDHCKPAEPKVVCSFNGPERTLVTFAPSAPPMGTCANSSFRTGSAALLPDCRGYEMVSPVDKNGANIEVVANFIGYPAGLNQGANDGQSLTYSAYKAFGEIQSAPYTSQYIAHRGSSGWISQSISPPREGPTFYGSPGLDTWYKGFTADLCRGWVVQDTDLALAAGAISGYPNLYARENCEPGAGGYEPLTTTKPPKLDPVHFTPELQGFSADGRVAIFGVNDKLTANAKTGILELYEARDESLKLVCILPNGTASKDSCSAGTPVSAGIERKASLSHAISEDGSRIFWTAFSGLGGLGKLYVRIDGEDTVEISGEASQFWTATSDGAEAFFTVVEAGSPNLNNLYEFAVDAKETHLIAEGTQGVAGASDDGARIYFVSNKVLTGEEENSEGEIASGWGIELLFRRRAIQEVHRHVAICRCSGRRQVTCRKVPA